MSTKKPRTPQAPGSRGLRPSGAGRATSSAAARVRPPRDGATAASSDAARAPARPFTVTLAAVTAFAQGIALAVWGGALMVQGLVGDPDSVVGAEFGGLTVLGLAALPLVAARGLFRVRGWGRGPVLITQLLALPVAWSMARNGGAMIAAGAAVGIVALTCLAALIHPATTKALS